MMIQSRNVASAEPAMTAQTYRALCRLIYTHSHIHLGPKKQTLLTSRLSKRRRELALVSWEAYADYAEKNTHNEIETLIDLISTNHTHFFRERIHFEILAQTILPALIQSSPTAKMGLRCWSAACSSGEEAYSLAIVLSEFVQHHAPKLPWQIMATDISLRALRKASEGIYSKNRIGLPDPALLPKYFQQGSGPFDGSCKVKEGLKKNISFAKANLFGDLGVIKAPVHLIFCRNVLIYFDADSQTQLVNRLCSLIEPGGYFIIGHSDSLLHIQHALKNLGNGIYQRVS